MIIKTDTQVVIVDPVPVSTNWSEAFISQRRPANLSVFLANFFRRNFLLGESRTSCRTLCLRRVWHCDGLPSDGRCGGFFLCFSAAALLAISGSKKKKRTEILADDVEGGGERNPEENRLTLLITLFPER